MSRYVSPVFEINDLNGAPQVGAKLAFYEPGTTTLKTIYSDSGLSVPRTNPVTAISSDAGAIYPEIFLDGLYKAVQQDNTGTADTDDGAVIWTRDPVGDVATGQFDDWLNDETYDLNDIVKGSDDDFYRSLVASNQGNDPISNPTKWVEFYTDLTLTNPTIDGFSGSVITSGTSIEITSGSSAEFLNIPSWVKKVTVGLSGVTGSASSTIKVHIGDATTGGYVASGYRGQLIKHLQAATPLVVSSNSSIPIYSSTVAANALCGVVTFVLVDASSNTWCASVVTAHNVAGAAPHNFSGGFDKSLAGSLDRLKVTIDTAPTFTAGKINILYEG